VVLLFVYFLATAVYELWNDEIESAGISALFALVCLALIGFPLGRTVRVRWLNEQNCRKQVGVYGYTTGKANEHGFESRVEFISTTYQWEAFSGYRASQSVALTFSCAPAKHFVIFARTKFASEADWQRFLELLGRKLPRV
jgi:hypothetical protein